MAIERISGKLAPAEALTNYVTSLVAAAGADAECAAAVARALVDASSRGVDTHGVRLALWYVKAIEGSRINRRWRQFGTGLSFVIFGLAGIVFGLTLFPLAGLTTLDRAVAKRRAQWLTFIGFRVFSNIMRIVGVISWEIHGAEKLRKPGQMSLLTEPTVSSPS